MTDHADVTDPTPGDDGTRRGLPRAVRVLLVLALLALAVFVLFTWVFPWITEIGFSPALDV